MARTPLSLTLSLAARLQAARLAQVVAVLWAAGTFGLAAAQGVPAPDQDGRERTIQEWLVRMNEASRVRSYVGTFVVSSGAGTLSSARIWHVCEGPRQVERVETLTGPRRSTFRRNDEVLTFLPEQRVVVAEKRDSLGLFTDLLQGSGNAIAELYSARQLPAADRVAGFDADVVQLVPRDQMRFGYRIWSERRTGLVIKLQTLDGEGRVLEQAAFSELQMDAPMRLAQLAQMMNVPRGWRLEKHEAVKTSASEQGWALRTPVPGFRAMNSYLRPREGVLQWIFSDGLASVSLFVEGYDARRHQQEGTAASGATHTLTRRVQDWWVTAVGEVPPQTLRAFALNLERRK